MARACTTIIPSMQSENANAEVADGPPPPAVSTVATVSTKRSGSAAQAKCVSVAQQGGLYLVRYGDKRNMVVSHPYTRLPPCTRAPEPGQVNSFCSSSEKPPGNLSISRPGASKLLMKDSLSQEASLFPDSAALLWILWFCSFGLLGSLC